MVESMAILHQIGAETRILYTKMKGVWPTKPRDAVVLSHVRRIGNATINVTRSLQESELGSFKQSFRLPPESSGLIPASFKASKQFLIHRK